MKKVLTLIGMLLLLGCASSGPTVSTNVDPAADFAAFKTFNFMLPLGTDRPNGVRTQLSNMLIESTRRELESRGMALADSPDVLVNFFAVTEEQLDVRTTPTMSTVHRPHRHRYSTWGSYQTTVRQFTQGTLVIDLVDVSGNNLVWEGMAQQRLGSSDRQLTQQRIDEVVAHIMDEFGR